LLCIGVIVCNILINYNELKDIFFTTFSVRVDESVIVEGMFLVSY